eukprot:scaffold272977_cov51-Attheya_sp.AAC.4
MPFSLLETIIYRDAGEFRHPNFHRDHGTPEELAKIQRRPPPTSSSREGRATKIPKRKAMEVANDRSISDRTKPKKNRQWCIMKRVECKNM